jgi:hypothetical protein
VRTVIITVVLPLPQFAVEQVNVIGDALPIEQLVELLLIHPMRALDLAV